MALIMCISGAVNKEFNGCVNSIISVKENEKVVENIEVINGKIELTSEVNETNMKSTENVQKCDIVNTNCTESRTSNGEEESNYYCKSTKNNNEMDNYQNNNTNISCDIVCTNGSLTKIMYNKVNSDTSCSSNSDNLIDIDSEKCKTEVHQFYQNLKSELDKLNHFFKEPTTTIKHVAHLEIEASKKKELENIVAEFEKKRISSPNPFLFVAELKTFIHNYDQQ